MLDPMKPSCDTERGEYAGLVAREVPRAAGLRRYLKGEGTPASDPHPNWPDAQRSSYPEPPWYLEDPDLWDGLGSMHEFLERERAGLE